MSDSNFQIIPGPRRETLSSNFQNYVETHGNLISAFTLTESINGGSSDPKNLFGFRVGLIDFVEILSHPGAKTWNISFGYDPSPEPIVIEATTFSNLNFSLILSGFNLDGIQITPNYKLIHPVVTYHDFDHPGTKAGESQFIVANTLQKQWTIAWKNLVQDATNVPKDIAQNQFGIMRGYNFPIIDFLSPLLPSTDSTNDANLFLDFRLVNHSRAAAAPAQQAAMTGTIGVIVGLIEREPIGPGFTQVSSFFDISSPCPPTCPSNTSQP